MKLSDVKLTRTCYIDNNGVMCYRMLFDRLGDEPIESELKTYYVDNPADIERELQNVIMKYVRQCLPKEASV